MNHTVGWYGQGSMEISFYGMLTEDNFDKYFDNSKTTLEEVNEMRKTESIPFDYLNDTIKDTIKANIYNEGRMQANIENLNYMFNVDVIIQEAGSERNRQGNFRELSEDAKDVVFSEIVYDGKTDSQIWCNGPILESEGQTLDDKLAAASKYIESKNQDKNKAIER